MDFKEFWNKSFRRFREQMGEELPFRSILESDSQLVDSFCTNVAPSGRVLDFGCGIGRNALAFAQRGFNVDICDVSDEAVEFCLEFSRKTEIPLKGVDYRQNRIDATAHTYDAIIVWAVLDHVTFDMAMALSAEFHRVLKPGGMLLVSFDPEDLEEKNDEPFELLPDGTLIFQGGERDGMLYRRYTNREIIELFFLGWEPLAFLGAHPDQPRTCLFRCVKGRSAQ